MREVGSTRRGDHVNLSPPPAPSPTYLQELPHASLGRDRDVERGRAVARRGVRGRRCGGLARPGRATLFGGCHGAGSAAAAAGRGRGRTGGDAASVWGVGILPAHSLPAAPGPAMADSVKPADGGDPLPPTPDDGLSPEEAAARLARFGTNELTDRTLSKWRVFLKLVCAGEGISVWIVDCGGWMNARGQAAACATRGFAARDAPRAPPHCARTAAMTCTKPFK